MNKPRKLIIVGQTPPPYNGQAKMIDLMIKGLRSSCDLLHIRMAYSDSVVSAGKFGLTKIKHLFCLIRETRRSLKKHPGAVLYYPPASPNLIPVLRDILFLCAVRPLAGKTVFHFHAGGVSEFIRRHRWLKPLAMKAYGRPDMAVELGASCPRDGEFFGARQVRTVPNGVDVFPPGEPGLSAAGSLRILYVGIHTETKGLMDLPVIGDELRRRGVEFEIRTAGLWYADEERARFESRRSSLNLENEIRTMGQKTGAELDALYAWANVFLFPTFYPWETFGLVQVEAMACGLPVVASDWPGPRDVVVNGETGMLCPAHNAGAFADALQRLAEDPDLREKMGSAGRARYEENFTAACFVRNIKRIFNEVCE
jgi:glycosyltransferase involved in cell wall biosynthesis